MTSAVSMTEGSGHLPVLPAHQYCPPTSWTGTALETGIALETGTVLETGIALETGTALETCHEGTFPTLVSNPTRLLAFLHKVASVGF